MMFGITTTVVILAAQEPPLRRFIAGVDAIAGAEQEVSDPMAQIESSRDLSTSLACD